MARPKAPGVRPSSKGKRREFDLLKSNLGMAGVLEEFLSTAYGPGGRGKLIHDEKGTPIPTFSGARMLSSLEGKHPMQKILTEAAMAQEDEWVEGTKLAALLALRLLRRAESLLSIGLHPFHILKGYERGLELAVRTAVEVSRQMDPADEKALLEVASSSLGSWISGETLDRLAVAVVRAAQLVAEKTENGWRCDRDDIHLLALQGSVLETELIHGYVLKRFPDYHEMPKRVVDARIALFDAQPKRGRAGILTPELRFPESKILLESPEEIEGFNQWEEDYTEGLVEGLKSAGANVVLCRLGISDLGHKLLADAGIMGIRRISKTAPMVAVSRATGASFLKDFTQVNPQDLGRAGLVEEREYAGEKYLAITDCSNPKVASLIVLAPGKAMAGQYEEQVKKAVGAVAAAVENPRLLLGGASVEMAASRVVLEAAPGESGRAQLAVESFGHALEDISALLAGNLGMDPLDSLVQLRHLHREAPTYGILAGEEKPKDLAAAPLREPLAPHLSAWERAVGACRTILRADDVVKAAGKVEELEKAEEKEKEKKKRYQ